MSPKKDYQTPYCKSLKGRYNRLRGKAKSRGISVDLTLEQFIKLVDNGVCYYSGHALADTGGGLDRIDSSKGYTWDNVTPCCHRCNIMKNVIPEREWYEHMKLIISRNPFL